MFSNLQGLRFKATVTIGSLCSGLLMGLALPAMAELPSEADRNNVTGGFSYEYAAEYFGNAGVYNLQVLSNRWVYVNVAINGINWEGFTDCATGEQHERVNFSADTTFGEATGQSYSTTRSGNTFTYNISGVTQQVTLPPDSVAELEEAVVSICEEAEKTNGSFRQEVVAFPNLFVPDLYDTTILAEALSNLGDFFVEAEPELATTYLKGAIEEYEQARLDPAMVNPPRSVVERTYRTLASTLLEQGRIEEAQETVDAFIVWELADYLNISEPIAEMRTSHFPPHRQYASAKATHPSSENIRSPYLANRSTAEGPVTVLPAERAILNDHQANQSSAMAAGQELAELRAIPAGQRTHAQETRIAELVALQEEINRDFNDFIDSPDIQDRLDELSSSSRRQTVNVDDLNSLRDNLKSLNAAIVYPLILEDRLELIITTPQYPPLRRTVYVEQEQLQATIRDFRRALVRRDDVIPTAQQLYQWLIAPLEQDLKSAGIDTLLYAPDGQLRYIPLAALHDGNQWLAETYQVNTITSRSLQDLNTQTHAQPQLLAAAFTDSAVQYSVELGTRAATMRGLPFAGREVELLTVDRDRAAVLLNQDFSLEAIKPTVDDYNIVHFATHAAFVPGEPSESFILFGNGDRPTLADVRNWSLTNVDMVVLSACQTGIGGVLENGIEILGMGYQFQRAGARSAVASLWPVDDGGTQVLMNAFYSFLDQGMGKTEALQAAQQAMIENDQTVLGQTRGDLSFRFADNLNFEEKRSSLSHPYYWAPFITIGNGL